MFSFKQVISTMAVVLLVLTATVAMAAEEKETITGHIYCVLPTAEGVKLEPGVCQAGDYPHIVKTTEGRLVLLQESALLKEIPRLTAEEKKSVTMEGKRVGRTIFNPEAVKWPWLRER